MNHITVIASIIAIAVSLAASADKPAQCAAACKDAAKTTVAATALLSDGSTIKGEFLAPKITGSTAFICDKDGISNIAGTPRMALLIDGKLIPDIQNHVRSSEDIAAIISTPTLLSFTHDPKLDPEFSTKSPFLIDEFKIWNYAKTDFSL